jgi:tetratricopeptide (TPR) repeat protein
MVKRLSLLLLACSAGYLITQAQDPSQSITEIAEAAEESFNEEMIRRYYDSFDRPLRAGSYLASRHAQIHHDWKSANIYVQQLIDNGIGGKDIMQRAMVLAIGNGDAERAISIAKNVQSTDSKNMNTVADILLLTQSIKKKNYDEALNTLKNENQNPTIRFIEPFLTAWIRAAQGKLEIGGLRQNTVQLYHAILISDYLDDHSKMEKMIDHAMSVEDITDGEIEKMADLYGHTGMKDKAKELYEKILATSPDDENIKNKIANLDSESSEPLFKKIKDPQDGIGQAFSDIAKVLFRENNDETARVFAHLGLYLSPDMTSTKFLVAKINIRHKQYDEALSMYQSISKQDEDYLEAQYEIASLYEETGRIDEALALLNDLVEKDENVDTLIKIGDLNRHQSNFGLAIKYYDRAVAMLGDTLPDEYWHLHYVRGISYEQANNWSAAEKELEAALEYRPDHPFILNYLGYAWADKGIHLDQALQMIQRASELRPSDGYIIDSLGWVMYRVENYTQSVKALERAVELLPYDPTINDHLGDAYWQVGRKLEARFQWERAKNHSDDTEQIDSIEQKLADGLME